MPGAPTPTGAGAVRPVGSAAASSRSRSATTSATAAATWLPTMSRVPVGVATRASATIVVGPAEGDAEDLGPADVDAVGDVGGRRAPVGSHEVDSTRAFSSRMAVAMMRLVARILMKPGMGTRSSASRWYVTSVPRPRPGRRRSCRPAWW